MGVDDACSKPSLEEGLKNQAKGPELTHGPLQKKRERGVTEHERGNFCPGPWEKLDIFSSWNLTSRENFRNAVKARNNQMSKNRGLVECISVWT